MIPAVQVPQVHNQTPAPAKRYFARVPHSRFCFKDGTEVVFAFGYADISVLEHQRELDAILGKNPNIFTQENAPQPMPKVDASQNALSEAELARMDKSMAMSGPVRTTGEVNAPTPHNIGPSPNMQFAHVEVPELGQGVTTADPDIQHALQSQRIGGGPEYIGPGAHSKLEEIRRAAAASSQVQPLNSDQTAQINNTGNTFTIDQ